jgi:hypothetical protein
MMKAGNENPQCQHRPEHGGKCDRCKYPMNPYIQARMKSTLWDNMSQPIKVSKGADTTAFRNI